MKGEVPIQMLQVDDGRNLEPGQIYVANEARFTSSNYQEGLTAYVVGYQDPAELEALLEFLSPEVNVSRRFEFKQFDNAESFFSETDDIRAIGSAFKRVEYTASSVTDRTHNKGLTMRIDHDDALGDDWQERSVGRLKLRLIRNEVRRSVALLDAAASNTNKTWGTEANPDQDMLEMVDTAGDSSGIEPNRVVVGRSAWIKRLAAYMAQNNAGAYAQAQKTPDQLAGWLDVDAVRTVKARYQSAATTKSKIVGSKVISFFAEAGVDKDDPSNIKRFVTPTQQGSTFAVYMEEHPKFTDITVEHYSNIVIVSTVGMRKLTIA